MSDSEPERRLFRPVEMPQGIQGRIFLHAMPGRREPLAQCWQEIAETRLDLLVTLTGYEEIRACSPEFATAIVQGRVPCEHVSLDIADFGVPSNEDEYLRFVRQLTDRVRSGESILIHCQAGIGRTGTLAVCVLTALGLELIEALTAVRIAGAYPVNDAQAELVARLADRLKGETDAT